MTRDYVASPSSGRRVDAYLRKAACDERVKDHSFRCWQGHGFRGFRHEHEGRRRESARARSTNGEETSASFRTPPAQIGKVSLSLSLSRARARTPTFSHNSSGTDRAFGVETSDLLHYSRMEKDDGHRGIKNRLGRTAAFHRLKFKQFLKLFLSLFYRLRECFTSFSFHKKSSKNRQK